MVLNPEEATAYTNLLKTIASNSVKFVAKDDETPKAGGGRHKEMTQLVSYANCGEGEGDHVKCLGEDECQYAELNLKNVEAYSGQIGFSSKLNKHQNNGSGEGQNEENVLAAKLAKTMANKIKMQTEETYNIPSHFHSSDTLSNPDIQNSLSPSAYTHIYNQNPSTTLSLPTNVIFPVPTLGKRLLSAMTKHMFQSTHNSEEHVSKITSPLPTDFKQNLISFFRRSSELLRHFFGLRKLLEEDTRESDNQRMKLVKIVQGMETVYREMEETRKSLPLTEQGEIMKKMCMPIMDQLDYAFKLNQGSGGGFSTVWN